MAKKFDLKEANKALRAKGEGKRNSLKVTSEVVQGAKAVLKKAALLNSKVTTRAKIEKLVGK